MKTLFILAFCLFSSAIFAQKMVFGGIATQNGGGLSNTYPMILEMKVSGTKVSGTSFFILPDGTAFVQYQFKGTKSGNDLSLKEYKILKGSQISGNWLLKEMYLVISGNEIEGSWKDSGGSGAQGNFDGKQMTMLPK